MHIVISNACVTMVTYGIKYWGGSTGVRPQDKLLHINSYCSFVIGVSKRNRQLWHFPY